MMKYKEPTFMRELHKQRERDARELYTVFGGDMKKWWKYKLGKTQKKLQNRKHK
mgnify:CR=1 FL=1